MEGELDLKVPAQSRFLSIIGAMVRNVGGAFGFEGKALRELELALDEACANVIEHGIEGEEDAILEVCLRPHEKGIELLLIGGRKPLRLSGTPEPDPSPPPDERREGGLGVYFIKKFMDRVEQEEGEGGVQIVRMVKYLKERE